MNEHQEFLDNSEKFLNVLLGIYVNIAILAFLALVVWGCCPECSGAEIVSTDGIVVSERVVNLPQDQNKWYLSVVGNPRSTHYKNLLKWFNSDDNLKNFKDQVHFRQISSSTVIYRERYRPNVKELPTIRLQEASGAVVYEAHGKTIPKAAAELYKALVSAGQRRRKLCPNLCPRPEPVPEPDLDPEPQPINNDGPPDVCPADSGISVWYIVGLIGAFLGGLGVGFGAEWRQTYS